MGGSRIRLCWFAAALLAAPAAADDETDARSGRYDFFSQPGIAREQALADYDECRELASAVEPPDSEYIYTPTMAGAAAAGFLQGMQRGSQRRHMFGAALRRCMALKGYARYATTEDDAEALYDGNWAAMRERLADRAIARNEGYRRLDP